MEGQVSVEETKAGVVMERTKVLLSVPLYLMLPPHPVTRRKVQYFLREVMVWVLMCVL